MERQQRASERAYYTGKQRKKKTTTLTTMKKLELRVFCLLKQNVAFVLTISQTMNSFGVSLSLTQTITL